jgi:quercetin dioxygenase-like cupin family protein
MTAFFQRIEPVIGFDSAHAIKAELFRGDHLLVGLNCFEPGQSQKIHTHAGADKFYFVISGKARMRVGDDSRDADAGTVVWAPAEVPHGVEAALERTVMLVAIGPAK